MLFSLLDFLTILKVIDPLLSAYVYYKYPSSKYRKTWPDVPR